MKLLLNYQKIMQVMFGVMVSSGNVEIVNLEKSNIKVESKSGNILCGNMNNRKYNSKIRKY